MYGEYPSLKEEELLEGDLHYNMDYRGVYGSLVEKLGRQERLKEAGSA